MIGPRYSLQRALVDTAVARWRKLECMRYLSDDSFSSQRSPWVWTVFLEWNHRWRVLLCPAGYIVCATTTLVVFTIRENNVLSFPENRVLSPSRSLIYGYLHEFERSRKRPLRPPWKRCICTVKLAGDENLLPLTAVSDALKFSKRSQFLLSLFIVRFSFRVTSWMSSQGTLPDQKGLFRWRELRQSLSPQLLLLFLETDPRQNPTKASCYQISINNTHYSLTWDVLRIVPYSFRHHVIDNNEWSQPAMQMFHATSFWDHSTVKKTLITTCQNASAIKCLFRNVWGKNGLDACTVNLILLNLFRLYEICDISFRQTGILGQEEGLSLRAWDGFVLCVEYR